MFRRAQCSSIILIAGIATLVVAAPPGHGGRGGELRSARTSVPKASSASAPRTGRTRAVRWRCSSRDARRSGLFAGPRSRFTGPRRAAMFRRAQCSSIILIAGIATLVVAAPPGPAAGEESFDRLVERVQGELGIGPADRANARSALEMFVEGRETFRFDTFGDEAFWGDTLRLHEAIMGERLGGVGPGLSPNAALNLGLKVDLGALPDDVVQALGAGQVDLDDPATTLALLELDAVVGVKGFFDDAGNLTLGGYPVRALPLHGRRLLRAGYRAAAGRLGEPRSRCRRDYRARPRPRFFREPPWRRRGHGADRAALLGARQVRRRADPGRQGVPARRQAGRDPAPAGVRPRRRQSPYLDRLGLGHALERLRRQPRDGRPGDVLRSAPERCRAVPDRGARGLRRSAGATRI